MITIVDRKGVLHAINRDNVSRVTLNCAQLTIFLNGRGSSVEFLFSHTDEADEMFDALVADDGKNKMFREVKGGKSD